MEQEKKENVFNNFIHALFGKNEIDSSYDDELELIDPDLLKAQEIADKLGKITEIPVLLESKGSKNGGFSNGLNNDTLNEMRNKLKVPKTKERTKEITKEMDIGR